MFLGYGIFGAINRAEEAFYSMGQSLDIKANAAKQELKGEIPNNDLRALILDNINNEKIKSLIEEYLEFKKTDKKA